MSLSSISFELCQIRDGARIRTVSHGGEIFIDGLEAAVDDVLWFEDAETSHEASDQIAKRFAGNGRAQTGSGTRLAADPRRGCHANGSLAESRLQLEGCVSEGLPVHGVRRGTLTEARDFIMDLACLEHGTWNGGHLVLVLCCSTERS